MLWHHIVSCLVRTRCKLNVGAHASSASGILMRTPGSGFEAGLPMLAAVHSDHSSMRFVTCHWDRLVLVRRPVWTWADCLIHWQLLILKNKQMLILTVPWQLTLSHEAPVIHYSCRGEIWCVEALCFLMLISGVCWAGCELLKLKHTFWVVESFRRAEVTTAWKFCNVFERVSFAHQSFIYLIYI